MDKMLILLQQLHLENEVSALKHAYIERVIVHKDNSYTFYIGASHIVPLTEIRLLFAAKKNFLIHVNFFLIGHLHILLKTLKNMLYLFLMD